MRQRVRNRRSAVIGGIVAAMLGAGVSVGQEPSERGAPETLPDGDDSPRQGDARVDEPSRDIEEFVADVTALTERRNELVQMADAALEQLRSENPSAADLVEQAYGHAVFDTTRGGLIVTGAGGTGVARETESSAMTFMHLGAGGLALGGGFESYKLVMAFEDADSYDSFVAGRWVGRVSARAAAGGDGEAVEEPFTDGIRVYRLTDGGVIAQIDASGMRFWPSEQLNRPELDD